MPAELFSVRSIRRLLSQRTGRPAGGIDAIRTAGSLVLEALETRVMLSASFIDDPANVGMFVLSIPEDIANTDDSLELRQSGGQLQYRLNETEFTSDLDSTIPGIQSLAFDSISRIEVSLFSGNDALTLDMSGGNPIPGLSGMDYDGGLGADAIDVALDTDFLLSDNVLELSSGGIVHLTGIEHATLTGGNSSNLIDASGFTAGSVLMDGRQGNDTMIGGSGNDVLIGTEAGDVLDGRGGNDILYSGNSGGTLFGGDGDDTLFGGNGKDFLYGQGGNDQMFGMNGIDLLDGGDGDDTLEGGSGNDSILGGAGADTVRGIGNVNFTLTDSSLKGLGNDTLASIESAILTGGAGNHTIDASGFSGSTVLDGGGWSRPFDRRLGLQ